MEANVILVDTAVFKADVSMKIERWVRFPHVSANFIMNIQKVISYFIKFLWFVTFLLIVFIDRNNTTMVFITISLLLLISIVTVMRAINSRNEWRQMIDDGEVEIKEKISFDK